MATLMQQDALARSTRLATMIKSALVRAAALVRVEPANQPYPQVAPGATMNASRSTKRQAAVLAILGNGIAAYVESMKEACGNNATIQGEVTFSGDNLNTDAGLIEGDVIFVVANNFDIAAGVLPGEIP